MIRRVSDIKPLFDFILLTEFVGEQDAKIILPGTTGAENKQFEVLAVGPGKPLDTGELRPMRLVVGDLVIMPATPALGVFVDGDPRKMMIVNEGNVVAVVGNVATTKRRADPRDLLTYDA